MSFVIYTTGIMRNFISNNLFSTLHSKQQKITKLLYSYYKDIYLNYVTGKTFFQHINSL